MGQDGTGWDRMGQDGTGWDRMRQDGMKFILFRSGSSTGSSSNPALDTPESEKSWDHLPES